MRLLADIARCAGHEVDGEWRVGCEDCLRRTDRSDFPLQVWMVPPPIIAFECEHRIEGQMRGNASFSGGPEARPAGNDS